MSTRYPIPAAETRVETTVVNSRFIATLAPAFLVDDARAFIQRIRTEFSDASHNVPAYLVGFPPAVTAHTSDDGEPPGTAGRPILAVLQGSGLGDVALVVTRYFGGTKLGTGGLVRAYTEAAQAVLAATTRAERVPTDTLLLALPYALFDQARLLIDAHHGHLIEQDFAADITLTLRFATEHTPVFQAALRELTNGALQAELIETGETILPL